MGGAYGGRWLILVTQGGWVTGSDHSDPFKEKMLRLVAGLHAQSAGLSAQEAAQFGFVCAGGLVF